jgi:uncharacterized protein
MNLFTLEKQTFSLSTEGAILIHTPSGPVLVVADLHLGKSATFRARGLPVPEGDTARDLGRLLELVKKTGASRLVIAGDLFHAPAGITPELNWSLQTFIADLQIPLTLVLGNHDAKIRNLPSGLVAQTHFDLENFRVIHDPAEASPDHFNIAGHWHPVVKIRDGKRTSLRLPCFLWRNRTLVLPSFGSFTGGAIITPEPGDQFYVQLRDQVVKLPPEIV